MDVCGYFGNPAALTINVPASLSFSINGITYTGTQTLNLPQGQYILAAPAAQATGGGSQIGFTSWSDGGSLSHTITLGSAGLSITGTFTTQYLLTISPVASGSTLPFSSGYYNAGSVVSLNASPNVGFAFSGWTGPVAAAGSAATAVTLNAPQTVMANFAATQALTVNVPLGVSFTLNGVNYTGGQLISLAAGQYTLATTSPQTSALGDKQLVFNAWSDGGALSHSITVGSASLSISGTFGTQYRLNTAATNGSVLPASGQFYAAGTVVNLSTVPNPGYVFHNWTGAVASASSATTTVSMSQAETVSANFWPAPSACVAAPPNITAWWTGNGSADDVTTLYNATPGGDVGFANGLVGQAFSFDGTQSPYVAVPAGVFPAQPGNGPFSFETWFQTAGGNGGVILGQQPSAPYAASPAGWSPAIYVGTDGNIYVEMFYSGATNPVIGPVPVNDNQWHHVAVTYDGSSEIVYLDGANIGTVPSYSQAANGSPLSYQLGTGYTNSWVATNGSWYTFNGLIDEPTVYSRALSAPEVLSIAQAGGYGKCNSGVSLSPSTLNFNLVSIGQNATLTAVLSNTGNAPLTISKIATDKGDANFSIAAASSGDCSTGTPVTVGGSCNVRVQFAPQTGGQLIGTVTLQDLSANNTLTQTIQLAGTSQVTPAVTFSGPASAIYGSTFAPAVTTNAGVSAGITSTGPCQVNGASVTMTGGIGTCQLQASWLANPPYIAATAMLSVNATPLSVTATITAPILIFNGQTGVFVDCALTNVLPADAANVTYSAASAAFADPGVGSNIPVTATGITLAGQAAANYVLSATTASTTGNIIFLSPDTSCLASPSGITAWWKGDGNANDATGNYNGTLGGDVSFAAGKVGQAFSFDGTQSPYVALPAGALPPQPSNGPFSFETWFQTTGSAGGVILGEQSGPVYGTSPDGWTPGVYVGVDGKLYAQMFYAANTGIETVVSAIPVNDGNWHHVAVTYDGSTETVFLDAGIIGRISSLSQGGIGPNVSYQLGTGYTLSWPAGNNGWYTFTGLIDEATVYSRALSTTDVLNLVQAEGYGKCNPGAVVNPGTLSFANVAQGQSATLTAQISNSGLAPLTITSIATDAGDTNFTLLSGNTGDCAVATPVAASASCNVRVQFAPQATGIANGQIALTDHAPSGSSTQTINLTGSGQVALAPLTIVSFTPVSGSALTQTFSAVVSDSNQGKNLSGFLLLFNTTLTGANGCYVEYFPSSNLLYLKNNANTGFVGSITPGTNTQLANSQCTVSGSGSYYLTLGTQAMLNVDLTFTSSTQTRIYLSATDKNSATTGWVPEGTWGAPPTGTPSIVSVTPNSGSGLTQSFVARLADSYQAASISSVLLLFNTTLSGTNGCYVEYYPSSNLLYLKNNASTAFVGSITPGSSAQLSNSQCTVSGVGSSYTASGTSATLTVALTFAAATPDTIYLLATDKDGNTTGWVPEGTWGKNGVPSVVSVTPTTGSGTTQIFTGTYADTAGGANLNAVLLLFNKTLSGVNGCYVEYYASSNTITLKNDANTAIVGSITPGSNTQLSNSSCTILGAGSAYSVSGNSAIFNLAVTFNGTSALVSYASASDKGGSVSGWVKEGGWTP